MTTPDQSREPSAEAQLTAFGAVGAAITKHALEWEHYLHGEREASPSATMNAALGAVQAFAAQAVARAVEAERERCATILQAEIDRCAADNGTVPGAPGEEGCERCAWVAEQIAALRSRGAQEGGA